MKRGYEDVGAFSGTRRRTGDQGLPRAKFGLKALLPDAFASFLLRDRGSAKEQLQEESGARLVFSNKGDFFPDTLLRVLGVFSDTAEAVMMALDLILGKIGELAEDERSRPPPAGCEMLGEEGEFIFRLILPRDLTGLLIGNQGANIKQLRRESGAKIVFRDDTVAGHRFITLSGVPESLSEALRRITEYMHQESGSDEFQQYLRVINFNDAGAHEGSGGQWNSDGQGKGGYRQPPAAVRMESKAFTQAPDGLHLLGEDLAMLPRGAAEMSYSVSCVLPAQLVPALIGKAGELVRSIQDRTGAKIDISRDSIPGKDGLRKMECIGPLLSIYSAHTLMMQRLQEVEQTPPPARRPERTSSPHRWSGHRGEAKDGYPSDTRTERQKELEAMVADLEKKLSEAKAMS
mmetsp:Transcript_38896/g.93007  ORF Transcript_38896/g.93007 Transcript_38896/m.93007 type:complete len:404 (+) Transcript_38896:31-1242(+)